MRQPLGQHFLKTPGPARALVRALQLGEGDTVVEVGPGHGELTRHILAEPHLRIIAIERDVKLAAGLVHNNKEKNPSLEVVHGDIREVLESVADSLEGDWKLAGNIPYYLTSFLVRQMGELANPPRRAALLMQKEVAERIAAGPGSFTKLAAFVGAWATPEIVTLVPKTAFSPPPRVDSAVLSFIRREHPVENRAAYEDLARRAFTQPRKVLANNLTGDGTEKAAVTAALEQVGLPTNARPQDLSVELIAKLAAILTYSGKA